MISQVLRFQKIKLDAPIRSRRVVVLDFDGREMANLPVHLDGPVKTQDAQKAILDALREGVEFMEECT